MRETIGGALLLLSLAIFFVGLVALFRPLPRFGLGRRWRSAVLMLACFLVFAFASSLLPEGPKPVVVAQAASAAPAKAVAATPAPPVDVGQPVQVGPLQVTVGRVIGRQKVGGEYVSEKASDGGILVVVEYSIKNASGAPVKAYEIPRLQLIDAGGVHYNLDDGKTSAYAVEKHTDNKAFSDLNPGITVHDAAVFEVSKTAFDGDTWFILLANGARVQFPRLPAKNSPT